MARLLAGNEPCHNGSMIVKGRYVVECHACRIGIVGCKGCVPGIMDVFGRIDFSAAGNHPDLACWRDADIIHATHFQVYTSVALLGVERGER